MTNTVPTQMIITSAFVKYERLAQLISHSFTNSNATELNVYIDLYGIIKTLFSDSYRTDISDYTAMTSTLLNMCGHYRAFFKKLNVKTKIFLIFSYNIPEINTKLVADYNSKFAGKLKNQLIKEMVELNNNLLETICPFLPDIFFLKTEFESSVLIDRLIRDGNKNPNLIISKDLYPCQLTYLHPSTAFIKPKKLNGEDISVIIPPIENINYIDDFWNMYCAARGSLQLARNSIQIHPINFTLLSAMTRFPERNYKSLINNTTANKYILNIVGMEPVKISVQSIVDSGVDKIPQQSIDSRQLALDILFMRQAFDSSIEGITIHLDNMSDPGAVNQICSQYFKDNPVELYKLDQ